MNELLTWVVNMNPENLLVSLFGLVSILAGVYIATRGKIRRSSIIYIILIFISGPVWALSIAFFRESTTVSSALFWDRIIYLGSIAIGILFFAFAHSYPRRREMKFTSKIFIYGLAPVLVYSLYFTNTFIKDVIVNSKGNSIELGVMYFVWAVWLGYVMISGEIRMLAEMRKLKGLEKEQVKFTIIGAIFPALGTIPTNVLLPMLGYYQYIWLGPYFLIIMHIIVGYGITQTRFIHIRSIVKILVKTIIQLLVIVVIISASNFLLSYDGYALRNFILALLLSILIPYIDEKLSQLLYSEKNYISSITKNFIKQSSTELSMDRIFGVLSKTLSSVFDVTRFQLIITNTNINRIIYQQGNLLEDISIDSLELIYYYWERAVDANEIIIRNELEFKLKKGFGLPGDKSTQMMFNLVEYMRANHLQVIIPLNKLVGNNGLFFIGDSKSMKFSYKVEDVELLTSLMSSASVALSRALLHLEVQNFNTNLQEKIDDATQELRQKVEQLEDARQKEQDMIDIMGHELRTPASVIKINADLLKSVKEKLKVPAKEKGIYKTINKSISRIVDSTENQIKLINALLTSAKIEGERLSLAREAVDLDNIFDLGFAGQEKNAKSKGIDLVYNKADDIDYVYADSTRLQQIVDNLLSNAVKYTSEGKVQVDVKRVEDDFAQISISDTGVGIPEEDIARLGEKFYRVGQYLNEKEEAQIKSKKVEVKDKDGKSKVSEQLDLSIVRPGGTGLGLYVTFELVRAHGGKIWVDSEVGVGTTFHFTIPIYDEEKYGKIVHKNTKNAFEKLGLD
ncbi:hypothetical protein GF357_01735 [Candidatus Dojkabacteria bacterium]|nr:hypothetical protein [Candidatus Dojkabacteria bacterium]